MTSQVEPLPFRLRVPDEDTFDIRGIRSVTTKVEGLLHLEEDLLVFEWTGTRETEEVAFSGVKSETKPLPFTTLELPFDWISDARLKGGWWRPRLVLRARRLDAFDGVPSATAGALVLWLERRDRELARSFLIGLELARADAVLGRALDLPEDDPESLERSG